MRHAPLLTILAVSAALLTGCSSSARAERPARISHVVLIKLENPGDAPALIADSDRLLPTIPGVQSYACGTPLDTGRATVDGDYDVGLYIGFTSDADYRLYVDHPNHVELIQNWKPRCRWLRIHDVLDESP